MTHSRMSQLFRSASLALLIAAGSLPTSAQQQGSTTNVVVPTLVNFSGVLKDSSGEPLTAVVGVSFYLYNEQQGGTPLWMETQNVQPDKTGHYAVMLGSTTSQGLPVELFAAGDARWLGVQAQGQPEQPRVMLLSVPYAIKAGDAETLGGKPASAYALAGAPVVLAAGTSEQAAAAPGTAAADSGSRVQPMTTCASVTSNGAAVANTVALFTSPCNVESSVITQSSGNLGIGGAGLTSSKLYLTSSQTNFGTSKWLQNNVFNTAATTSGSNTGFGLDVNLESMTIPAGVTDSGSRTAIRGLSYAATPNFAGTLNAQWGVLGEAGISQAASGAKVGNAYGGQFVILNRQAGTTISNAYGVYIYNADTTGTITHRYDLYASSPTANNYFAGKVGVGTISPGANLEVSGTAKFDGLVTFKSGQTFPGTGTVTSVVAGTGLSGGTITSAGTINNTGILGVGVSPGITSTGGQTPTLGIDSTVVPKGVFGSNKIAFKAGSGGTLCTVGSLLLNAATSYPSNYLPADGSTLTIAQYPALFSAIGTNYGGNGTTNFALPNLKAAAPNNTQYLICALAPEPGTLALFGSGLILVAVLTRRRLAASPVASKDPV